MAFVSLPRSQTTIAVSTRIAGMFANMKTAIRKRRMYRKTIEELSALTDRELNDLGLCRSMISDVARTAVYN